MQYLGDEPQLHPRAGKPDPRSAARRDEPAAGLYSRTFPSRTSSGTIVSGRLAAPHERGEGSPAAGGLLPLWRAGGNTTDLESVALNRNAPNVDHVFWQLIEADLAIRAVLAKEEEREELLRIDRVNAEAIWRQLRKLDPDSVAEAVYSARCYALARRQKFAHAAVQSGKFYKTSRQDARAIAILCLQLSEGIAEARRPAEEEVPEGREVPESKQLTEAAKKLARDRAERRHGLFQLLASTLLDHRFRGLPESLKELAQSIEHVVTNRPSQSNAFTSIRHDSLCKLVHCATLEGGKRPWEAMARLINLMDCPPRGSARLDLSRQELSSEWDKLQMTNSQDRGVSAGR